MTALWIGDVSNAKNDAVELISTLPDDATLRDIEHHLHVLEKIRQGEGCFVSEGGVTQDAMERELGRWGLAGA